jgi:hypothetical protein
VNRSPGEGPGRDRSGPRPRPKPAGASWQAASTWSFFARLQSRYGESGRPRCSPIASGDDLLRRRRAALDRPTTPREGEAGGVSRRPRRQRGRRAARLLSAGLAPRNGSPTALPPTGGRRPTRGGAEAVAERSRPVSCHYALLAPPASILTAASELLTEESAYGA